MVNEREWQAGRELDAEIAEKVFRRVVTATYWSEWLGGMLEDYWISDGESELAPVPRYSTDIAAAWQMVEHRGGYFSLSHIAIVGKFGLQPAEWACRFAAPQAFEVRADTAPLAICRAALITVTDSKGDG